MGTNFLRVFWKVGWWRSFLEKIYQSALAHELKLREFPFEEQMRLPVMHKGILVGDYIANFVIDEKIILEIKGVSALNSAHEA